MSFLSISFMKTAFVASLLGGTAVALIGFFIVLRRLSFGGLAVSQLAALGAVLGILVGHSGSLGVAISLVLLGFLLIVQLSKSRRVPEETWVGSLYIAGASLAVLILSKAPWGEAHTLNVFFGNILTLGKKEIGESAAMLVVALFLFGTRFHRWIWISFDPQSAEVSGISLTMWNMMFYFLFAIEMTLAIHIFGVLLAFSYLLLPCAISLLFGDRLFVVIASIAGVTVAATVIGFSLSFRWDLPTGPFVSAILSVGFLLAALLRQIGLFGYSRRDRP